MTTKAQQIDEIIRGILRDNLDPKRFRKNLARQMRCTVEEVDAAIESIGGEPSGLCPESVAQARLADERRYRRNNPHAWRAANHEEE